MPEGEFDEEIEAGWEFIVAKGQRGEVRESAVTGLLSPWTERMTHIDV